MTPLVCILMGSKSDYKILEAAAKFLDENEVPFEMHALSAHRTHEELKQVVSSAADRGLKVIIAAAGMAAHLPGVVASLTHLPVIGVPVNASFEGLDALLSIVQMPPGIPVATVGVNGAQNAAILALQILAVSDKKYTEKMIAFKAGLKKNVIAANEELAGEKFSYRV